jgi:hypothetical protein
VAAVLLVAAVAWVPPNEAAHADNASVTLRTAHEAWYHVPPTPPDPVPAPTAPPLCALPTGCPPATVPPVSPYPEHTLHVGRDAGTETERTYLAFDLSSLPDDAKVVGGSLRVPVAGAEAGTVNLEGAAVQACLVFAPVVDVAGGVERAPDVDCRTSSTAVPVAEGDRTVLGFDLAAFALDWAPGAEARLALMPAPLPDPANQAWHVAFHGRGRTAADAVPITARFDTEVPPPDDEEEETDNEDVVEAVEDVGDVGGVEAFGSSVDYALPAGGDEDLPVEQVPLGPGDGVEPAAVRGSVPRGFAYPVVFALPLLFIMGFGYFGRLFTLSTVDEHSPRSRA